MTDDRTPEQIAADERAAAIQGLRDLADFLDAHPGVPAPRYNTLNVLSTKDEIVRVAWMAAWKKYYAGDYFSLRREFAGPLILDVYVRREEVCHREVVGTRVVPAREAVPEHEEEVVAWRCDAALLATE